MRAERIVDGVPVNPVLPRRFWDTDNRRRPRSPWWDRPFVRTEPNEHWPGGLRFDTCCLDGGAWDRPTVWGAFGTLEEAIRCAREGPAWRQGAEEAQKWAGAGQG